MLEDHQREIAEARQLKKMKARIFSLDRREIASYCRRIDQLFGTRWHEALWDITMLPET